MSHLQFIFETIENLTHTEGHCEFVTVLKDIAENENQVMSNETYMNLNSFIQKIFLSIDELISELNKDETILISVKNQKLLRTCFQVVTSLSISPCLIPGLGIKLSKRCITGAVLPMLVLTDEQKYEMLVACTDFFTRSYSISALKTIIITLHLSDYLAALIQLSFAPFKKPGTYSNFTMTQEMYDKLSEDRKKYLNVYNHLVSNCFQPVLMKELLVLQSGSDPSPPAFAKRVIAKELSQRLISPGGLLSLIRCFIESYDIDTGFEWKKIDMICRIIAARHGTSTESEYLANICNQLQEILSVNNTHYLAAAVACVLSLNEKFPQTEPVVKLTNDVFQSFDYNYLTTSGLPGTMILSPQEVEQKVKVLHACVCTTELDWPVQLLLPNLYVLYYIGTKCTKNDDMKIKLKDILIKSLEKLRKDELYDLIKIFLFGKVVQNSSAVIVEEYDAGVAIKSVSTCEDYSKEEAVIYFMDLFKSVTDNVVVTNIFTIALRILLELNDQRQKKGNKDILLTEDDDPVLIDAIDEQYAVILQLLSEISTSPKVVMSLKSDPMIVFDFIEHFILKQKADVDNECVTIALVLLNTILSNAENIDPRFRNLVPVLRKISKNDSDLNSILCKEALSLISSEAPQKKDSACEKAISDTFDELLPVRAHGIIELTKLIDAGDAETISKKHYVFCIFQEQLKDTDSYIYLSAVNGLAALCTHCTEDVLQILCKEFLQDQIAKQGNIETHESQNRDAELRMKIGDVIVKVTKRLGEMAVVHKTILLNTMLCAVNDGDPLIRTSALSNLAEIALVLHYRIGSIIYEVLYCIWSIIQTDKAIECRRAAVMVIASLIKGLGKETLLELKDQLLPIYRTLKSLYGDENEDKTVRLHAQIALEELNDVVRQFLFPELKMEKQIFVLDEPRDVFK
ncbi:transport and Golgi organization protein 6 [Spodoptera litura]|uniref:Transport and Golgi organization protein 6 n=1 Tax=Spodoptera litura TaxID=69820 RepID=A0A9J7E1V3_SPOLT|nr:transport and Golgi organization protein 6 [Spodoptera litura]